jgi:hypothetical protein
MAAPGDGDGARARAGTGPGLTPMEFPFRGRSRDDFDDELQAHLDLETDRLIAEGMSPAAARAFGNVTRARERFYEASRKENAPLAFRGVVALCSP